MWGLRDVRSEPSVLAALKADRRLQLGPQPKHSFLVQCLGAANRVGTGLR